MRSRVGWVPALCRLRSPVSSRGPDEANEGRLVVLTGTVVEKPTKATSGDIALWLETTAGIRVRVMADASSRITATSVSKGSTYRVTGVAGQRASRKGALDGYRVWLRDAADLDLRTGPPSSPSSSPSPSSSARPTASASPRPTTGTSADGKVISVASALRITDRDVVIGAVVTAPASLLDATGRRIVVGDGTGAIEVLLPKDVPAPGVGTRIRLTGRVGVAYGAPRLRAESMERLGSGRVPAPLRVRGPLGAAHTWRLVAVSGRIDDVRKLGDRWRAEIVVGAAHLVVVGQPGAQDPGRDCRRGPLDRGDGHRPAGLPERVRSSPDDPAPVTGRRQRRRRTDGRWPDERGIVRGRDVRWRCWRRGFVCE